MDEDEQKLSDVAPDEAFRTATGTEIKNLKQLIGTLNDISEETFSHHVNEEKNDFADWIKNSVKDDELSSMLSKTTDFEQTKRIVQDRIELLEKKIEVKQIKNSLEGLNADEDTQGLGIEQESMSIEKPDFGAEEEGVSMPEPDMTEKVDGPMPEPKPLPEVKVEDAKPEATKPVHHDIHPFEHLKRSMHITIRDVTIGIVIGMIIGIPFGAWLF